MAQQDKATLKQAFETGDAPTGSDFENLIDSQLNLAETTAQTINGPVNFAGGVTFASISAATVGGNTGTFGTVSTSGISAVTVSASNIFGLARAECFATSPGTISTTAINSYVVTNVGTSAESLSQFTHNGSGRLTYTGSFTKNFMFDVDFTVSGVTASQNVAVRLGKDGTSQSKTTIELRLSATSAPFCGHVGGIITLTANSYVEVLATATLNVSNIVFEKLNLRAREV
jgi:hypothetical protein